MADLWTCPECRRQFVNVNQWHSCTDQSLAGHLESKTELAVSIYQRVEAALRLCGEFRIHPQKTQVAFIAQMTFAGVKLAARWADLSLVLPYPLSDPRIRTIDLYGPTGFGHSLRLMNADDVDDTVQRWLCDAHTRGEHATLDSGADVEGVVGHALEVLMVPLRSRVVAAGEHLAFRVPRYAGQAFSEHPHVLARIQGSRYPGEIALAGDDWLLCTGVLPSELGLGVGDEVDVFITADL